MLLIQILLMQRMSSRSSTQIAIRRHCTCDCGVRCKAIWGKVWDTRGIHLTLWLQESCFLRSVKATLISSYHGQMLLGCRERTQCSEASFVVKAWHEAFSQSMWGIAAMSCAAQMYACDSQRQNDSFCMVQLGSELDLWIYTDAGRYKEHQGDFPVLHASLVQLESDSQDNVSLLGSSESLWLSIPHFSWTPFCSAQVMLHHSQEARYNRFWPLQQTVPSACAVLAGSSSLTSYFHHQEITIL